MFDDLPEDPLPPMDKPAAKAFIPDDLSVSSIAALIPPIPSASTSHQKATAPQAARNPGFSNPWVIHTFRDLWQFFHMWVTIVVGLEIYVSIRLARLEKVAVNLDVSWEWVALPIFGLLMLLNLLVWMRYKNRDFRQFHQPLLGITIAVIILGAASELGVWMLK